MTISPGALATAEDILAALNSNASVSNAAKTAADAATAAASAAQTAANAAMPKVGGSVVATGSTAARTLEDRAADALNVKDFGAKCDGITDDVTFIQAALNAAVPGQSVWLSTGQHLVDSANLNIPIGVTLLASWNVPGTTSNSAVLGQPMVLATLGGAIVLNPAFTITMASGSAIKGVPIYRKGLVIPAANASSFAGTAISIQGDDCYLGYVLVLGFDTLSTSTSQVRGKYEWVYGDNQNGISIINAYDTPYLHHCHMWPFTTYTSTAVEPSHRRTGTAYRVDGSALISLSHCFCISYFCGYELSGDGGPVLVDCQADGIYDLAVGFLLGSSGATSGKFIACTTFANAGTTTSAGYVSNIPVGDYVEFIGCSSTQAASGFTINSGDVRIIGGTVDAAFVGVQVSSATSVVVLDGLRAINISSAAVFNPGGGGSIYISPSCDWGRIPHGISSTLVPDVIASASPLAIPSFNDVFQISGSTGFGIVNFGWAGRRITLVFGGSMVVSNSGVANGIRLNGSANFSAVSGSSLSLVHNGTQWFETGRSV